MNKITCNSRERLAFDPVFVCGAPRSGTTVLLSLICTSRSVNPLSSECDYFTSLVHPYILGRNRFDVHTHGYFASLEDFERYHADIMRGVLTDIWTFLERPEKLVLKDPSMTRYANIILKLLPECRMVISVRDPRDVVASRVAIEMRRLGVDSPSSIAADFIDTICGEFNYHYKYVISLGAEELQRVKLVKYEQLVEGSGLSDLALFIDVNDINQELLWQRSLGKVEEAKNYSEWVSRHYGKKMTSEAVGSYRKYVNEAQQEKIEATCGVTYDELSRIGGWR